MDRSRWPAVVAALALSITACGGDDDTVEPAADAEAGSSADDGSDAGGDIAGSLDDGDLVVPRDYLQGDWCDGEGQDWSITGDIATLTDASGGTGEFPLEILFATGVGVELISQSDDRFVFGGGGDEVTFVRGACG